MTTRIASHGRRQSGLLKACGAAAGTLALALASAQAAPAPDPETTPPAVHVRYGDLNLATSAGVQTLYRRIAAAAREVCPRAEPAEMDRYRASRACQQQAIERAVHDVHDPHLAALQEQLNKG